MKNTRVSILPKPLVFASKCLYTNLLPRQAVCILCYQLFLLSNYNITQREVVVWKMCEADKEMFNINYSRCRRNTRAVSAWTRNAVVARSDSFTTKTGFSKACSRGRSPATSSEGPTSCLAIWSEYRTRFMPWESNTLSPRMFHNHTINHN